MSRTLSGTAFTLAFVVGTACLWAETTAQQQGAKEARAAVGPASQSHATLSRTGDSTHIRAGTRISAELISAIDARTAKPGDQLEARVTKNVRQDGKIVVHKGDHLVGQVSQVRGGARANAGSRLAVTFDHLVSGNSTSQLSTVLTSVFSSQSDVSAQGTAMSSEPIEGDSGSTPSRGPGSAGGGLAGGLSSAAGATLGATAPPVESAAGTVRSTAGVAGAADASGSQRLVAPLSNVRIHSEARADDSSGLNSVLSTRHGDLRIEPGARLEFRVPARADVRAEESRK